MELMDQQDETSHAEFHVPTGFTPQTPRRISFVAALLVVALCVGFAVVEARKHRQAQQLISQAGISADAPPTVDVVSIQRSPTTQPLTLPGQTSGWYESTIYARVNGYVADWQKDIGDRVNTGEVLATIETPELDAQLQAAQAKLNAADAQVKVEDADVEFTKATYTRVEGDDTGAISKLEHDQRKAQYDTSLAKLNAAHAQVHLCQAEVDSLLALTKFKEVRSPYVGVITKRKIDKGDLVTAGSTASTTPLYSIARTDKIRVFVDVPQSASAQMQPNVPVNIVSNEFPGRTFPARITRTSNAIDVNSRTLHVEADLENTDGALEPGLYVEASFQLAQKPFLQVPASALMFRSGGPQVAVVTRAGRIKFHDVTIAIDQGDVVDVEADLTQGQKIALNLSNQINDDDLVKPVNMDVANDKPALTLQAALPQTAPRQK